MKDENASGSTLCFVPLWSIELHSKLGTRNVVLLVHIEYCGMWMQNMAQVRNKYVFTYCYGHGERGLGKHVCERAAVEVVSEQILAVFVCVEPPRPEHLAQDGLLTVAVNAVRGLSGPVRSVIHEGIVILISLYAFN